MRTIDVTPKLVARFFAKVDVGSSNQCWNFTGLQNQKGYGQLGVGQEMVTATHIALTIAGMPRPSHSMWALHHCDNPSCCNPTHLYWGTVQDNNRDRQERGRCGARGAEAGERNHQAKLNAQKVREIRASPLGVTALAREYGVSTAAIIKVIRRETWAHVN